MSDNKKSCSGIGRAVLSYMKREAVLTISVLLGIISCIIIRPGSEITSFIDWDTLLLLYALMAVMAGYQKIGIFKLIGGKLLSKTKSTTSLILVLVFLPFFFSMLITNDVGLITFVPFAIIVLKLAGEEKLLVWVVVLQTFAANLGSMLTPMGNPQNLYLYGKADISFIDFMLIALPYTLCAGVCILICCLLTKKKSLENLDMSTLSGDKTPVKDTLLYSLSFLICILSVLKIISPLAAAVITTIILVICDIRILMDIDYALLGTFAGFFVFIGNMQQLPEFRSFIERILTDHEVIIAILSSQIISNVPAALLLSGFTDKLNLLIIGVNLGGLGTLIASMASLISYKQIARKYPDDKGKYLFSFTLTGLSLLAILLVLHQALLWL